MEERYKYIYICIYIYIYICIQVLFFFDIFIFWGILYVHKFYHVYVISCVGPFVSSSVLLLFMVNIYGERERASRSAREEPARRHRFCGEDAKGTKVTSSISNKYINQKVITASDPKDQGKLNCPSMHLSIFSFSNSSCL